MGSVEIHITDVEAFLRCKRLWNWQSLMRRGLQPAGMPAPLFLGQGVHVALDAYYSAPPDDRTAGLLINAFDNWVDARSERMKKQTGPLWRSEKEMIDEMYELGTGMLLHYALWAEKRDKRWEFLATERKFVLPMPVPKEATRGRGYSDLCRNGMYMSGGEWYSNKLSYAGRFDGVVRDVETGKLYLMEFKTSRSLHNMRWTYRGMQSTAYVWAANQMVEELTDGQCESPIDGIMYRVLLKKIPQSPKPLVNGGYSQAKNQKTSFEYFKYCLDKIAERENRDPHDLYVENENILRYLHQSGNEFFDEKILDRTPQQIDSTMRCLYHTGKTMADPNVAIFPQPGFHCSWCAFETPCSVAEVGGDYEGILEVEYAERGYWEDDEVS